VSRERERGREGGQGDKEIKGWEEGLITDN